MHNLYKRVIVTLLLTIVLISCKDNKGNEESLVVNPSINTSLIVPITVIKAEKKEFYEYGYYYGRTQGINRASIINISGGTVESIDVSEGQTVSKGQSLAKISSRSAEITLESAKLNEKLSYDNYQKLKEFLKSGNTTPLNVDQAHLGWLSSQSSLINAQKNYDGAFSISPISGVVVSKNIRVGDEVAPGQNCFLIEDLSQIEVEIGIPEADIKGVKEGNIANITLDVLPGEVWEGKLVSFSRRSSDKNLTFNGTVVFNNKENKVLSGTTAKIKLLRNSYKNNVVLPINVIANENGENYVMIVSDNKVKRSVVVLGSTNENEAVVLSGVNSGDILVNEGLHLVVDNQEVTIISKDV